MVRTGATELRTVRPGTPEYRTWIDLASDAYPILARYTVEERDAMHERDRGLDRREPEHRLVAAFRDGVLVGGMRLYDFTMRVRDAEGLAGGVGSVAVGLAHKQRGVARDLITGYLREYRERGAALAVLHPFRPAFYRKLGFGYGSKMSQYRLSLDTLAADDARERVRRLGSVDAAALLASYHRVQARQNGLIRKPNWAATKVLADPKLFTFGYDDGTALRGYLTAEIRLGADGTANRNDFFALELVYETPTALAGLLAFMRSQSDQFAALIVNTQDPDFHFVPSDPRNGGDRILYPPAYHETNVQGVGVMYRVIDVPALLRLLAESTFGDLNGTVRIDLTDTLIPENAGSYAVRFTRGCPTLVESATYADVDLAIDVADFSSLMMGSVRLRALVDYGRATLSQPDWLHRLDTALITDPPMCLTRF